MSPAKRGGAQMTLETFTAYAQLAGNFAVAVTLVFVAVQLRLSVKTMRLQAMSNHAEKFQSISRMMVEGPGVAELWVKAKDGLAPLSEVEKVRYVNLYVYMLRAIEEMHLQLRAGLVDRDFWEASIQILRDAQALAGPKEVWAVRRHIFSPAFRDFVEAHVASGPARPLYGTAEPGAAGPSVAPAAS